jgi:histidinol-phosphatase (PHP family)
MEATRFDYHIHESFSSDARGSNVEKYIEIAEQKGIEELAFTTHQIIKGPFSYFGVQPDEVQSYIDNIHRHNENTDVKLLVGLEVDYFLDAEKEIESLVEEYPFDIILGSVHFVGDYDIGARKDVPSYFSGRSLFEATSEYHEIWCRAVESGLFDIMAHPDYWRRFLYLIRPEPVRFFEYGLVEDAIDVLISYDVGIEVNSAGIRHQHGRQYPIREFLEASYNAGLDKITIGSDSHIPEHLGYWLVQAISLLKNIGYKHISSFKNRKNTLNSIDSVVRTIKNW